MTANGPAFPAGLEEASPPQTSAVAVQPAGPAPSSRTLLAGRAFSLAEHALLIVIGVMTLGAASTEVWRVIQVREITSPTSY